MISAPELWIGGDTVPVELAATTVEGRAAVGLRVQLGGRAGRRPGRRCGR